MRAHHTPEWYRERERLRAADPLYRELRRRQERERYARARAAFVGPRTPPGWRRPKVQPLDRQMKLCSSCGDAKRLGEFRKWGRLRLSSWCKLCLKQSKAREAARARRREAVGDEPIPKGLVQRLLNRQRGLCGICALPLAAGFHIDHRIPIALGGRHIEGNLQLTHALCNLYKGARATRG